MGTTWQRLICESCGQRRARSSFCTSKKDDAPLANQCALCRRNTRHAKVPTEMVNALNKVAELPLAMQRVITVRFLRYHKACERQELPDTRRNYADTLNDLIEEQKLGGDLFQTAPGKASTPIQSYRQYRRPAVAYWED